MVLARVWPQIARTVVLDDEHLLVEPSAPIARTQLLERADLRGALAESGTVLVLHRGGHLIPLQTGHLNAAAADEMARLLDDAIAE